ncbi:trefoil factor 1 [Rhinolophus ferrumequinum]|nr:trefoil factor 1 [Rhinolophus ferrumequinum]
MESKVIFVVLMVFSLALSTLAQYQAETCQVDPIKRQNCGPPGVSSSMCAEKGCCFDSTIPGFPWCFHPMAVDNLPEEEC